MSETVNQPPLLQRLPSCISGLDRILQGDFFRGGSYILMGPPRAGKTVLGNQLCFQHVATGGRALYFTLLAETYSRMLAHLRSMTFYTFVTLYKACECSLVFLLRSVSDWSQVCFTSMR